MHIRELFPDVISEDLDYEYKTVLNPDKPIKWAKTIVGYANGKGGVMFVGVSNEGEAFGITQQYSDLINSLQSRIHALEDENRLLKERLDEAGVSYADIVSGDAEGVVELYDPDQGARIKKFDVTDKIASDFFMML